MLQNKHSWIVLLCLFSVCSVFTQEQKPKVAVVLSGGGAKGIAHIPLLQTLDSLGIVPDLIVGTSMGSAVGGLYAIGYSGDSIAHIATTADWGKILSGESSLDAVGVEEKSEYGRYNVSLDLINGKPKIKTALVKDQNLREFLSSLVYPAYKTEHFDDLFIPFRAVTTDLVNGKQLVLEDGSLSTAIRASISIPGVFQPVEYGETLLVDGGVVNNFPSDIAKALGADIIIGSDVSQGLLPKEKLGDLASIIFQTSMLTSGLKVESNRELCDVLLNHNSFLSHGTSDFVKAPEIYEEGKMATRQNLDALVEIANRLKTFQPRRRENFLIEKIHIDEIKYEGISDNNLEFFKARLGIQGGMAYTINEIEEAIDRAMGTEIFEQITFKAHSIDNKTILVLTGYEKAANRIGGALHYDTYQGVGVVVNYTGRNVLGKASRLLIGLDVAEEPKLRVQYQKNIGLKRNHWWNLQLYGENLEQSYFREGRNGEILKTRYWQAVGQINKNLNPLKDYIGLDLGYISNFAQPKVDPTTNNNIYDLRTARFEAFELSFFYLKNTFNDVFFPTRGSYLLARASRSITTNSNVEFQENSNLNANDQTNGFVKLNVDYEHRFQMDKNALILRTSAGFILEDRLEEGQLDFYQYGQLGFYQLGGQMDPNKRYAYSFKGLPEGDLLSSQFIRFYLAYQINPIRNIFATPYINASLVGFGDTEEFFSRMFSSGNEWQNTNQTSSLYTLGTTLSYNSIIGPVNLDVAYVSGLQELELYFGVGIKLNLQK